MKFIKYIFVLSFVFNNFALQVNNLTPDPIKVSYNTVWGNVLSPQETKDGVLSSSYPSGITNVQMPSFLNLGGVWVNGIGVGACDTNLTSGSNCLGGFFSYLNKGWATGPQSSVVQNVNISKSFNGQPLVFVNNANTSGFLGQFAIGTLQGMAPSVKLDYQNFQCNSQYPNCILLNSDFEQTQPASSSIFQIYNAASSSNSIGYEVVWGLPGLPVGTGSGFGPNSSVVNPFSLQAPSLPASGWIWSSNFTLGAKLTQNLDYITAIGVSKSVQGDPLMYVANEKEKYNCFIKGSSYQCVNV